MNTFSVQISSISKSYGNIIALNNIDLAINHGEMFGLIGADGAGKTTLLRILTTLLLPDNGSATVEGLDVVKDYKKIRKIVGYMPGRFSLYPDLTVEENLTFFARSFKTTIKENYHLIKDIYIQIEPFKKRPAGKLSGGMKQKLALCCALIHKPTVLFLDEPSTGVDAVSRKEFWEMLRKLKASGITIVVSTPYMDEASMCDRVALIQKGKFLSINTPAKITEQFEDDLWAVKTDDIYHLIHDLRQEPRFSSVFAFGDCVHVSAPFSSGMAQDIEKVLLGNKHTNIKISKIKAGIEDCFMALMNKEE